MAERNQLIDERAFTIDPAALEPDAHLLCQLCAAALHNVFDARQCRAQEFLPGKASMRRKWACSAGVIIEMAMPVLLARPVRPMRWT